MITGWLVHCKGLLRGVWREHLPPSGSVASLHHFVPFGECDSLMGWALREALYVLYLT